MASHKDRNNDQNNSLAMAFKAPFVEKPDECGQKTKLVLFSFASSIETACQAAPLTESAA